MTYHIQMIKEETRKNINFNPLNLKKTLSYKTKDKNWFRNIFQYHRLKNTNTITRRNINLILY